MVSKDTKVGSLKRKPELEIGIASIKPYH